eukprot:6173904-Pleurochrysis_carterae.AAC.1
MLRLLPARGPQLQPTCGTCVDPGGGGWGLKHSRERPSPSPSCVASEWRVPPPNGRNVPIRR